MKRIINIISIVLLATLVLSSCSKFLDRQPYDAIGMDVAFTEPNDVKLATIGVYSAMRSTAYRGKTFLAVADFASDIATKRYPPTANGWFDDIERMQINENTSIMSDMWTAAYITIDRAARTIQGGKKLLNSSMSDAERKLVNSCIAQCYAVKALAIFDLTLFYALPYNVATAANVLGVPNVGENPITINDVITRATLATNYNQILSDIANAKAYYAEAQGANFLATKWIYMNEAAVYAVEARVNLYMRNWNVAKTAAQNAIDKRDGGAIIISASDYYDIWTKLAPSSEDIFVLTTNTNEATGATAIGNLYGPALSYCGRLTPTTYQQFASTDIRLVICEADSTTAKPDICYRPAKYNGDNKGTVSNVPVFRLPEMYLIIAECETELDNETAAQTALFEVAQRNTAYTSATALPNTVDDLREFIKNERIRELMVEGHRFWDMRRTGELLSKTLATSLITYSSWDCAKFAFPIPQAEINVTHLPQNDWSNNLPQFE